jgi:hypothetical protein
MESMELIMQWKGEKKLRCIGIINVATLPSPLCGDAALLGSTDSTM